jgi:mutator protein MutT
VKNFTIRVYGILINNTQQVLVSDECRNGLSFTKFPGGGLEFGEGLKQALQREFLEEMGIQVEVKDLFYVNDYPQISAFSENHQLFSFYFWVHTQEMDKIIANLHEVPNLVEGEKQRWVSLSDLHSDLFTFPIDKIVAEKLVVQGSF